MKRRENCKKFWYLIPGIQFKYKRCQNIKIHRFVPIKIIDTEGGV